MVLVIQQFYIRSRIINDASSSFLRLRKKGNIHSVQNRAHISGHQKPLKTFLPCNYTRLLLSLKL